jgi:hypothetical protein
VNAPDADEVTRYAAAVRAALTDLPQQAREDLLEDIEDHLHEVAAEEGSLEERLGPPSVYAEELRRSAGLTARPASRIPAVGRLTAATGRLRERLESHASSRAVLEFLPELRPAWWVLRGYVAVQLLALLLPGSDVDLPWASLFGSPLLGLLVTAGAVVGSVAVGRGWRGGRHGRLVLAANVVLALFAFFAFFSISVPDGSGPEDRYAYADPQPGLMPPWLVVDGRQRVTNIYPFDSSGRPLKDVFLYDQDGRPIDLNRGGDTGDEPIEVQLPRSVDGRELANVFPQQQWRHDYGPDGETRHPVQGPNVGVPKLAPAQPTPTTTPSPTPTLTPAQPTPTPTATSPRPTPTGTR